MAPFAAHVAFMLEFIALAAGLVALHYGRQWRAALIKAAGICLLASAVVGMACTGYYVIEDWRKESDQNTVDFNFSLGGKGPHCRCTDN